MSMDIEYDDDKYQRLVTDAAFTLDFDPSIVKSYRKKYKFYAARFQKTIFAT
jgi:hypothetical protein